ncbi:hypothetical protein PG994_006643 [Apiospora phragmitis]|uniref:Uncharacterized protein n=1 Tax=Apiospora phragmitis TaxID=2905665 RepID=A0ABR1VGL9_9PEZI
MAPTIRMFIPTHCGCPRAIAPRTGENVAENDAFAGPNSAAGEKPAALLTPWVIIAITAASFLAATFVGFVGVSLLRRRQRHRQRLGANAAAAVRQHNNKYYYHHSREGSYERPWPSPSKSHYHQYQQQPEEAAAELQRSQLIGKSRASRESWGSFDGSVVVADATCLQRQQQQNIFSKPHSYTAVSAYDHHRHHSTSSKSTTVGGGGTAARRNHDRYCHSDDYDSEDEEFESAPKQSMSSSDWKELEAQDGRLRSSSLQDPATLGRGHPAFSPELQRAQLPARLPRTLVVTDLAGRRAAP